MGTGIVEGAWRVDLNLLMTPPLAQSAAGPESRTTNNIMYGIQDLYYEKTVLFHIIVLVGANFNDVLTKK